MRNRCTNEHLISALLDGELPDNEADALHRHLEDCDVCRRRLASFAKNDARVKSLPPIEPSDHFDRTFWSKVDAIDARRNKRLWRHYLFSGWRPAAAAALAGALVAAILFVGGLNGKPSPEEIFLAEHVELFEEYDLISQLDMLEHWDAIEWMEEPS